MTVATIPEPFSLPTKGGLPQKLPPLREEINLFPGAPTLEGKPTWIIQDPVAQRFYRIGWQEYEILLRWSMRPSYILSDISFKTTLQPQESDIAKLLKFLTSHNLIQSRGPIAIQRLKEHADKLKKRDLAWVVKNYLFIRIPLIKPDKFLTKTLHLVSWTGSRFFLWLTVIIAVLGLWLVQRNWDGFLTQLPYFFTFQGVVVMFMALAFTKILHELGHAYTCKHFGCNVPSMGVALLVLWPVLYTDATDAWRLTSRRKRFIIASAGIATELALAAYATLLWNFLPDGPARSAIYLIATATWITTLFINLNPFMRFDGYYLLSDSLGIPNMQERAFSLARWRLREFIFGLNLPAPEKFPLKTHRLLLVYAYGTWIYRFFLFLGIALLVYFLFFKVLGIILMVVELVWFIGKPIWNEIKAWTGLKHKIKLNVATIRTSIICSIFLFLLIIPWQSNVHAPALWRAEQHSVLYSPAAAQVVEVFATPGKKVHVGDMLFELDSPLLNYELSRGQTIIDMLQWQTEYQGFNSELLQRAPIIWRELQAESASQHARQEQADRLIVRSPIDGIVREIQHELTAGVWVTENEQLGIVLQPDHSVVEAWVNENELSRLQQSISGKFYPDDPSREPFNVRVTSIDTTSTRDLQEPYLASVYGGPIAVRVDQNDRLIPDNPVYRIRLEPEGNRDAPEQLLRGTVSIEGSRESIIGNLWRSFISVIIRESGF